MKRLNYLEFIEFQEERMNALEGKRIIDVEAE